MTTPSENKNQIKIKFFTNEEDESLQVSNSPLYVPVTLKRFGLSEVVNHLLGNFQSSEDEDKNQSHLIFL